MSFIEESKQQKPSISSNASNSDMNVRPVSARGAKTVKEAELSKALIATRQRVSDRDSKIKKLEVEKKQLKKQIAQLEKQKKSQSQKVAKETKMRTHAMSEKEQMKTLMTKIQRSIAARMNLLGIDFTKCNSISEALDAALSAINRLIKELEEKEAEINKLKDENAALKTKIANYEAEMEKMRKKLADQSEKIKNQNQLISEQKEQIQQLTDENTSLKDENASLKSQLSELQQTHKEHKEKTTKEIDFLRNRVEELEKENTEQAGQIKDLEALVAQLREQVKEQQATIEDQNSELEKLRRENAEKDKIIATQSSELEHLRARVKELEDEIWRLTHIPKADKEVQTELSGEIEKKLTDYHRLLKEIVALRNLLGQKNDFITKLEEENRELLNEMDDLMKKTTRFHPCRTNHKGEILALESSPNRYLIATGATDLTCRLWKCDPDHKKNSRKVLVCQRALVEGKLDAIAWSQDGKLLAGGTGYKDGPDGYVLIWSMFGDDEYNTIHAIRSRPTVRFGRVNSIAFSTRNNQYVYCGDTTGSIWVFDLLKETTKTGTGLVGVIQTQSDLIHGISVSGDGCYIYSVSHDETLAVCELPQMFGGQLDDDAKVDYDDNDGPLLSAQGTQTPSTPVKSPKSPSLKNRNSKKHRKSANNLQRKSSMREMKARKSDNSIKIKQKSQNIKISLAELLADDSLDKIKHIKGVIIEKDGKYPFWRLCISQSGNIVCCASRKVRIFKIKPNSNPTKNGSITKGPSVSDGDLDHVKTLKLRNGYLLVCRPPVPRAKLFNVTSGQEFKKLTCKLPVTRADFLADNAHIICCQQEMVKNEPPRPCVMKLFKFSDNRIEIQKEVEDMGSQKRLSILSEDGEAIAAAAAAEANDDEKKDDN